MRFATYEQHGRSRVATVGDDGVLHPHPGTASLLDLIQAGPEALRESGNATLRVPGGPHVSQVRLLPPLQLPSVRDFVTFEEHVEGVRRSIDGTTGASDVWYDAPTFCFTNPYAVIAAHDEVRVPPGNQVLDVELQVADASPNSGASAVARTRHHSSPVTPSPSPSRASAPSRTPSYPAPNRWPSPAPANAPINRVTSPPSSSTGQRQPGSRNAP